MRMKLGSPYLTRFLICLSKYGRVGVVRRKGEISVFESVKCNVVRIWVAKKIKFDFEL